jgi:hypothetical protein
MLLKSTAGLSNKDDSENSVCFELTISFIYISVSCLQSRYTRRILKIKLSEHSANPTQNAEQTSPDYVKIFLTAIIRGVNISLRILPSFAVLKHSPMASPTSFGVNHSITTAN